MQLDDLPKFTVTEIHGDSEEGKTIIVGHLSHLRSVRGVHGYLFRAHGPSILGDLETLPSTSSEPVRFLTSEAEIAPELKRGATYPWLDGSWKPYHLKMALSPVERWQRRVFSTEPARWFELDGHTGWQPLDAELPPGATDLGVRPANWSCESCELCPEELEASRSSEAFVDPDGRWICAHCFERYVKRNDISFAFGDASADSKPNA